jgi:hypothetical protein
LVLTLSQNGLVNKAMALAGARCLIVGKRSRQQPRTFSDLLLRVGREWKKSSLFPLEAFCGSKDLFIG